MRVRDVMTPDIEVLDPDDSLKTAVTLLADLDVEAVPVTDNDRLIGMITGRDIAMRIVTKGRAAAEITVGETMSPDVLYCFEDEAVGDVARKMSDWWVRRLPVVRHNKRLIGIVSLADVTASDAAAQGLRENSGSHRSRAARSKRRVRHNHRASVAA